MVAKRLTDCLAETDADIFDSVVGIDRQIAIGVDDEIEEAVAREERQEVIQCADTRSDVALTVAIKKQIERDAGFCCLACDPPETFTNARRYSEAQTSDDL